MNIRDLIRIAVLKTNLYWPFSILNQLPYYLAIRVFTSFCSRFPEITSVYLRHPLVKGKWTPALSDIDMTIIINSRLDAGDEFSFLSIFWQSIARIKKLFPMIGEIEILDDQNVKSLIQFDPEGYLSRDWQLLYGEAVKTDLRISPHMLDMQSRKYAFWFYLQHVLEKFYSSDSSPYLTREEMKRLMKKINRCLSHPHNTNNAPHTHSRSYNTKADLLYFTMKELEEKMICHVPLNCTVRRNENEINTDRQNGHRDDLESNVENILRELEVIGHGHEAVSGILMNQNHEFFIILKDGVGTTAIESCLGYIRRRFASQENKPIILTSCLFQYMIRFYEPYNYYELLRYRKVVYGQDPLPNILYPDEDAFIHFWVNQTTTLLSVPRSSKSFFLAAMTPSWYRQVASYVRRSLILKLYLENGIIKHTYKEIFDDLHKYYPEEFEELTLLQKNSIKVVADTARQKWFELLRKLTNDIHKLLSASPTVDRVFYAVEEVKDLA